MTSRLSVNAKYMIAVIFMLLFIFSDLLFDLVFTFELSDTIAFIFTILSAIIVFLCNGKIRNDEFKKQYYKTTEFIKSNFDNFQVIFSVLDIICGLVSIFSTYFFLAYSFKIVRIFFIPTKILVILNKEKSLLKPFAKFIIKFSFGWTSIRILEKKGGNMANFFKSNKQTLIFGTLISALCAVSVYYALPLFVKLATWIVILIAVACFVIVFALVFIVGHDTIESLALRLAKKVLPADKYEAIYGAYKQAVEEVNKAKEDAQAEKKAKAIEEKAKAEAIKRTEALKKAEEKKEAEAERNKKKDADKEAFEELVKAEMAKIENNNN